jgi:site-specific DNA-methyltransferase (adenine-specific)
VLKLETVPVVRIEHLSPEQIQAYTLADNQLALTSKWDADALAEEIKELYGVGFDLDLLGFDPSELAAILEVQPEIDESLLDEVPEVEEVAITKPGDLWELGDHRLLCGDSTKLEDVALLLVETKIDLVLTDPPYGVSYVGKTKDALKIENDQLNEIELSGLIMNAFNHANAFSRPGAYWYATVPAGPLHILFAEDWKKRGILRQIMVWVKDSMVLGHSEYHYQHEPILFGWVPGERHKNKDRTRTTVWQCERPRANREHPTMKPLALWERAINDGSRSGEVVYDPFLGSGTTLIAAEQLGRKCKGIEISPQYCDVIIKRWQKLTGKRALNLNTGDYFGGTEE